MIFWLLIRLLTLFCFILSHPIDPLFLGGGRILSWLFVSARIVNKPRLLCHGRLFLLIYTIFLRCLTIIRRDSTNETKSCPSLVFLFSQEISASGTFTPVSAKALSSSGDAIVCVASPSKGNSNPPSSCSCCCCALSISREGIPFRVSPGLGAGTGYLQRIANADTNQNDAAIISLLDPKNKEHVFPCVHMLVRNHINVNPCNIEATKNSYPTHLHVAGLNTKQVLNQRKRAPPPPKTNAKNAKNFDTFHMLSGKPS
mmetsp:Transcript_26340/g.39163  ORF Transcript_26340/g.39163 Transcript_26340/m.39163 type:complete len:257 (-) Transcript_26340:21-791(-)